MTKEFLGKRVAAFVHVSMFHVEPLKDAEGNTIGCKIRQVNHSNPGGSIPNMVLNAMTGKQTVQALKQIVELVKTL
eukprot:CAMPEP_0176371092 /NCGR_PEP_ID=MMETSP0126-20121128/24460_1 /TAXON_ID=141414 ORGANISM="Strombidinopsis acuminatum, Strain SPMC142" /NCGR_SAMPLE_ID=MMETSP0126 /ASSEMBLY_ACC=CAM_ASM_000229 /LENGTH=75 /DNA_ID=CAMNT_0017730419 /DNA_START=468 /DNA_END=695 /DNA_ORIENTATION=+